VVPGLDDTKGSSGKATARSTISILQVQASGTNGAAVAVAPTSLAANRGETHPRTVGRPISSDTEALYQFCYEQSGTSKKASVIKLQANARFGDGPIPDARYVRIYAKRYAKRHGLHLPPRNKTFP